MIGQYLGYAGAAFAFAAAVLWFKSAFIRMPSTLFVGTEIIESSYDGSIGAFSDSPDLTELGKSLRRQSLWSAYAAVCAGIAAFVSALGLFLGSS